MPAAMRMPASGHISSIATNQSSHSASSTEKKTR